MNNRTYPRASSYEQMRSEQPWHTKTGRLEFYRPDAEFIESGEIGARGDVRERPLGKRLERLQDRPLLKTHWRAQRARQAAFS